MAIQRKCSNCATWNGENDYCSQCGEVLNPVLIEENREAERESRRQRRQPDQLDRFLLSWKYSRFLLLRWLYYLLRSIAILFFAIASFFAWLAASPNG